MSHSPSEDGTVVSSPSMLDLVRLSPRRLFPPGGEALYRQIALLTGMGEEHEVLDVGCGRGVSLEYFVREYGVQGSGIDEDARLVRLVETRARDEGLSDRMHVQTAPAAALPYRDEIFDITVGELGTTATADPADAVRELVRVTRPGGVVVLVQLVWKAPVDPERRAVLGEHLGVQPLMLVEWKRLLKDAGVTDLHTEDWTDDETAFRPHVAKPFPDFSELFSVPEKLGILRRAWGQWGWSGVRSVLARERIVHRLLTRERILGLDLLMGTRNTPVPTEAPGSTTPGPGGDAGLPLFPEDPPHS
ncbi:MAG: methyltransferase domain-containing protein [Gemmatimonadota bacterium]|jgi:SAM-dependent methyltransferase